MPTNTFVVAISSQLSTNTPKSDSSLVEKTFTPTMPTTMTKTPTSLVKQSVSPSPIPAKIVVSKWKTTSICSNGKEIAVNFTGVIISGGVPPYLFEFDDDDGSYTSFLGKSVTSSESFQVNFSPQVRINTGTLL